MMYPKKEERELRFNQLKKMREVLLKEEVILSNSLISVDKEIKLLLLMDEIEELKMNNKKQLFLVFTLLLLTLFSSVFDFYVLAFVSFIAFVLYLTIFVGGVA